MKRINVYRTKENTPVVAWRSRTGTCDMKDKAIRFLKKIKDECGNGETVILFALVVALMYCPVWGGYALYALFRWKWCFAVASAYLLFWAGPFTPFFPCCVAITMFVKKLIKRR